jgi:hypothetical protein
MDGRPSINLPAGIDNTFTIAECPKYRHLSQVSVAVYGIKILWDATTTYLLAVVVLTVNFHFELTYIKMKNVECCRYWRRSRMLPVKYKGMVQSCISFAENTAKGYAASTSRRDR